MNVPAPGSSLGVDRLDAAIIDGLHDGFPLSDRPFADVGERFGLSEDEVLERIGKLLADGVLTRFGPLYHIERAGGAYLLAAMAVPEARFDAVAALVNAHHEVAHNYRREHALNMWFVVAAASQQGVLDCIAAIEAETGLTIHSFPREKEYHVELRLPAAHLFDVAPP